MLLLGLLHAHVCTCTHSHASSPFFLRLSSSAHCLHLMLSPSQDASLKQFVESLRDQGIPECPELWTKVADLMPSRDATQCSQRWRNMLNPALVKGPWTKEVGWNERENVEHVHLVFPSLLLVSLIFFFLSSNLPFSLLSIPFAHMSPLLSPRISPLTSLARRTTVHLLSSSRSTARRTGQRLRLSFQGGSASSVARGEVHFRFHSSLVSWLNTPLPSLFFSSSPLCVPH